MLDIKLEIGGQTIDAGTFQAGIVNQALHYAADQRVVATTIVGGLGDLIRRQTYLHPSLSDTPLGCRVVESDRFVDALTFDIDDGIDRSQLAEIAEHRMAIYSWQTLIGHAYEDLSTMGSCSTENLQSAADSITDWDVFASSPWSSSTTNFLDEKLTEDASKDILSGTFACLQSDQAGFGDCVCSATSDARSYGKHWHLEDHTSQLRETETVLDESFAWLQKSESNFDHLVMWLHSTYSAHGLGEDPDDETAVANDFPPDQISTLNEVIVDKLLDQYLTEFLGHPDAADFMAPLEEFVILQRLFRAALTSKLGEEFPFERLISLERETSAYVASQPTIRWEYYSETADEFASVLQEAGDAVYDAFLSYEQDRVNRRASGLPTCGVASL